MSSIISIENLTVEFDLSKGGEKKLIRAVNDVTLDIKRGEVIGIIGESGSGKTTLASAVLNLVQSPGRVAGGVIEYIDKDGSRADLCRLNMEKLAKYRWEKISCVFQAAQNALNPILKIKDHFIETVLAHDSTAKKEDIVNKALSLLKHVRLSEYVMEYYPYQLSGGMKQRVLIAMSLILDPEIIILDEPTTALDVITQKFIMTILQEIHEKKALTMVFLTHDIAIIASMVDRLAVMYAGKVVEYGTREDIFKRPKHPYTYGLLRAIPTLSDDPGTRKAIPGMPPNMLKLPQGCAFQDRCYLAARSLCDGSMQYCSRMMDTGNGHITCCEFWERMMDDELD